MPFYISSSGRIEIEMSCDEARSASHQGRCDDDVLALSEMPAIAAQLAALDPADVRRELDGYGCWDDQELADHQQNLQRVLWLAAGDVAEECP